MSKEEEEIWAETSDDEKYNPAKYKKGTWEPKPEDILKIFEEIKTKKVYICIENLSLVVRRPVLGVPDQVRHKPAKGSTVAWWLMPRTPDPEVGGSSPTRVKPCCVLEQGTFTP